MRLPLTLLRRRLAGSWDLAAVQEVLARSPLELEGVERHAPGMDRVLTGRITEAAAHPDADRLRVCAVDAGVHGVLQIVTAATNVQSGDIVPVALDGAVLPTGKAILASKMRGVMSQGMFCSLEELALGDALEGVWVLPATTPLGLPIAEAMDLGEWVLELAVPAHRGDLLSAHGVARELASLGLGEVLPLPEVLIGNGDGPSVGTLAVAPAGVLRYAACVIDGVTVPASSPDVARLLDAAGLRSVDGIVDVTNMMLLEFGQPMHAFDRHRLEGDGLSVRPANPGETLVLLDGRKADLDQDDLVIADARGPVALAGVMGGADSAVRVETTSILIEVASFDPTSVRATARRHQLQSESSQRFARGVDAEDTLSLLAEAVRRIVAVAGGRPGAVSDIVPDPTRVRPSAIVFRPARTRALLGVELSDGDQLASLQRMGAHVTTEGQAWTVVPPHWRRLDLHREVDLVEEVAFQTGLDSIPAVLPPMVLDREAGESDLSAAVRSWATAQGLDEVMLPSLVPVGRDDVFAPDQAVAVAEGMGEFQVLRRSLWPGLVDLATRRRREGAEQAALFEIGQVAWAEADGIREELRFAALLAGPLDRGPWLHAPAAFAPDVRWGQGLLESLLANLKVAESFSWDAGLRPGLQPGRTAILEPGAVGVAGEMHPDLLEEAGLAGWGRVVLVEVRLPRLGRKSEPAYFRAFDRHPVARRDLAVVVDRSVTAGAVAAVIRETAGDRLRSLRCFDRYSGQGIPEGTVSLAMAMAYGAEDRTLKDAEVEAIEAELLSALQTRLGASRRA